MQAKRLLSLLPVMILITNFAFACTAPPIIAPAETPEPDAFTLAAQYEAAGETDKAIAAYEKSYAEDPRQLTVLRKLLALCTQEADAGNATYADTLLSLYEDLYRTDQMTESELLELCALLSERGQSGELCTVLERAQRIDPTPEKQALLDALVIDVSTASDAVQQAVQPVYDALEQMDTDAAVPLLLAEDFSKTVRATTRLGTRRYLLTGDGGALKMETAYNATQQPVLSLWYLGNDHSAAMIRMESDTLSVTKAIYRNGALDGAFTSEYYEAKTGGIFKDAGTFTNNLLTGDITTDACFGEAETTLPALWDGRAEATLLQYAGSFDETGHTTAKQQSNVRKKGVIYAYQVDKKSKFIYVLDPEALGSKEYIFDYTDVGVALPPTW